MPCISPNTWLSAVVNIQVHCLTFYEYPHFGQFGSHFDEFCAHFDEFGHFFGQFCVRKIAKILSIRINILVFLTILTGCAEPIGKRAVEGVGPVTAYARNTLANENPEGLLTVAEGFERSGDDRGARALYAQAMAVFAPETTQHLEAKVAYARTGARIGRSDESVAILTVSLRELGAEHTMRNTIARELATIHTDQRRYRAALSQLSEVSSMTVQDMVQTGMLLSAAGKQSQADKIFEDAVARGSENTSALRASALSFALGGDYSAAVALLSRMFDAPVTAQSGQNSLADIYALSGQRQAALSIMREQMTPDALQRIGVLYRLLPSFTKEEKAAYLYFGHVPRSVLGRLSDDASN